MGGGPVGNKFDKARVVVQLPHDSSGEAGQSCIIAGRRRVSRELGLDEDTGMARLYPAAEESDKLHVPYLREQGLDVAPSQRPGSRLEKT